MTGGIVFDLDETLYEQAAFKRSAFLGIGEWLGEKGLAKPSEAVESLERIIRAYGPSHPGMFDLMLTELGLDQALVPTLVEVFRSHTPTISVYPGVVAMLLEFRLRKLRLGLLTDGLARVQRAKVAALGIEPLFDEILYSDDLGTCKPDEILFSHFEERFSLPGEALVHVADNPAKDFVTPNKRGWLTVRVRAGEHREDCCPKGYDAELSIPLVTALPSFLE